MLVAYLSLVSFFLHAEGQANRPHGLTTDAQTFSQHTYDFLIVGGGTAGIIVATRLSEIPAVTVGVIEAGQLQLDNPLINTPMFLAQSLGNPLNGWNFNTVPQPRVLGRSLSQDMGKVLGGSSAVNALVYHHASKGDYDNWGQFISGGWDWDGFLPFLKKAETVTPGPLGVNPGITTRPGSSPSDGRSGPLPVSYNSFYSDLEAPYTLALKNLHIPLNPDPDSGNCTGFFNAGRAVDPMTGNRTYSALNYFLPNSGRPNLLVLIGAQATKVNMAVSGTAKARATGIQFQVGDAAFNVNATREVILSAGSLQSPQLLELSGIGNKSLLQSLGIPVVVDLPTVGENMQDHVSTPSIYTLKNPQTVNLDLLNINATFAAQQEQLYVNSHTGALTYTASALGFHPLQLFFNSTELSSGLTKLRSDLAAANLSQFQRKQANIQINSILAGSLGQIELAMVPGLLGGQVIPGQSHVSMFNFGSRLFSRGSVHINTTNPFAPPLINPNYMSYDFDIQILVNGLLGAERISQTPPFSNLISSRLSPPPNVTSVADFTNYVLQNIQTESHPVGTCSLGPNGEGGVVDGNLTVYGTQNLRVIDASVMPMHIAAHIQGTVYGIGEKGAAIIKASLTA